MTAVPFRDDPWPRLPFLVPAAALISALSLMGFLHLLAGPAEKPMPPPALELQVIELPPTPPAPAAPPVEAAPPPIEQAPAPEPQAIVEPPKPPPKAPRPPKPQAPPQAAPPPPQTAVNPAPAPPIASPQGGGTTGARALYQPLPEIPRALRHRAIDLVAVARFRVSANGSAEVELVVPTPDAGLNRALMDSLRQWRFFPAMAGGKPVASTIDIRIPISVR